MKQQKSSSSSSSVVAVVVVLVVLQGQINIIEAAAGEWRVLQASIGVSAMHMQLLYTDTVVVFDRTDFGKSNLTLPDGKCRHDLNDTALKIDCTAHSVDYHVPSNTFRPLMVHTDVWCSSGSAVSDGSLVQTGGFNDGERRVRRFEPCGDWNETDGGLAARRWYATNHVLPDGRQIILGGRRQYNYEFYPKSPPPGRALFGLPFLGQTTDWKIENNLYPFVFLNVDGNLFVFANNRAVLLDYEKSVVVRTYPEIPGGDPRSYPSTGSAVLLPLRDINSPSLAAEVLVCGGAPKGSFLKAANGTFAEALKTCARIRITDPNPVWEMEDMPTARVMGDMTILPNGDVLIVNGCSSGTAGWEFGRDPVFNPVLYRPGREGGSRFEVQSPTTIPRMYHSTAVLLRDGRVLVGGSNPHVCYNFTGVLFPTELSLEAFSPGYLDSRFAAARPRIVSPGLRSAKVSYGQRVVVRFEVAATGALESVSVTMAFPSFATHSFSMNQRMLVLPSETVKSVGNWVYEVAAEMPGSALLAPPGYYLLFVVRQQIPSEGIWVHIN